MYFLQSLPVTATRIIEASTDGVDDPTVPVVVPQEVDAQGASALLVPGAKQLMVKSKGALLATVPGTRKTTASMGSLLYLVPLPSQHLVLNDENGTKLGPLASVMVAHQRLVASLPPLTPWIWMRNEVTGATAALQLTAMPVAPLGMVAVGGPSLVAAFGSFLHWSLLPVVASLRLKPISATEL